MPRTMPQVAPTRTVPQAGPMQTAPETRLMQRGRGAVSMTPPAPAGRTQRVRGQPRVRARMRIRRGACMRDRGTTCRTSRCRHRRGVATSPRAGSRAHLRACSPSSTTRPPRRASAAPARHGERRASRSRRRSSACTRRRKRARLAECFAGRPCRADTSDRPGCTHGRRRGDTRASTLEPADPAHSLRRLGFRTAPRVACSSGRPRRRSTSASTP